MTPTQMFAGWAILGYVMAMAAAVALCETLIAGPAGMRARWMASCLARWLRERRKLREARREMARRYKSPLWADKLG